MKRIIRSIISAGALFAAAILSSCTPNGGLRCTAGSCQNEPPTPRIAPIFLYNPQIYEEARKSGRVEINTITFLGFFIEGMQGKDVVGRFMPIQGTNAGSGTSGSSWVRVIRLVR